MAPEQLAAAGAVGICVLSGWLAALLWRAPAARRAHVELERLRAQADAAARRAGEEAALARLHETRGDLAETDRRQAELRARVAEAEAEELQARLSLHEATPCVLCGLPLPLCAHGREERTAWLEAHGGGFPVQLPPAAAAPPRPALPASGGPAWRVEAEAWREVSRFGAGLLVPPGEAGEGEAQSQRSTV